MTRLKKTKVATRKLATIVAEIHETNRNDIGNVIRRGNLLLEAKAQLNKHGAWLTWLDQNFSMDARTAQRAIAAAKFAAKYDSKSFLNLTVEALYKLSSGGYPSKTVNAVMREAKSKTVNAQRVGVIWAETVLLPTAEEIIDQAKAAAEAKAEAEEILDGLPPDLAPPEYVVQDPDRFICEQLTTSVLQLKKLVTKKLDRFAGAALTSNDIAEAAEFLMQLRPIVGTKAQPEVVSEQRIDGGAP